MTVCGIFGFIGDNLVEILLTIFASFFAWLQYSKDLRNHRFIRRYETYEVLSEKLCAFYLLMIKTKGNEEKYLAEYHRTKLECAEYLLTRKLNISSDVSSLSMGFIQCEYADLDLSMSKVNAALDKINKELGTDATDTLHRLTQIETLVQSMLPKSK